MKLSSTPLNFSKGLLYISIFIVGTAFTGFTSSIESNVYICKGPESKKYHYKKDCRGLSRCSTNTYKVTIAEAKKIGRTLCGWED
ncbi:MAG: hypothetical protein ACSHW7_00045 [Patiriisocius sp.]|uniref:hypothetical protein n=1 Tax=Patiriisocius sp. TaxID=2822396 RepID=UPI003EF81E38